VSAAQPSDGGAGGPTAGSAAGLNSALVDRALASSPTPLADSLLALVGAESRFEQRDRVVEVFRAQLRLIAALVLAARLQFGVGPEAESAQVPELLRQLRGRGLTDGQWVALIRELLRPWQNSADAHPLPLLVRLVHARKSELLKLWDELLVMRKSETVAHGATGTREALQQILSKRVPQLGRTLELLQPLWSELRLVVPREWSREETPLQPASLFVGPTPTSGRFRRIDLAVAQAQEANQPLLLSADGQPLLALAPVVIDKKSGHEDRLFILDGPAKRGALYVCFPTMVEHRESAAWASLDAVLSDEEPAPESEAGGGVNAPQRPYRGLSSFGPSEAALFFGREDQAESLANRIRRCGFVTLTGASGSGKTSLLRAGALPLLKEVMVVFVRPGAHPLASLVSRIAEALERPREEIEALASDPKALRLHIEDLTRANAELFVLVMDQAEELLTVSSDNAERDAVGRLLRVLGQPEGRTRVVVSVREDFFARLATIPALFGVFSQTIEIVTTPDREALFRILIGPAKAFGYSFEDEELATAIIEAVENANAALALLSFTADRLWEARDRRWKRLTRAAYEALGGALGALASHADNVFTVLSAAEQTACRSLLLRLVTGEKTRAIVPLTELLSAAREAAETQRVLDRLVAARLLTMTEDASGESTVELVHEALIQHWARLAGWLSEDEQGQRLRYALRQAAREWESRSRPRGLLWRGELLSELSLFLRRAREPLAEAEQAFASECQRAAVREKRVRNGLLAAAFISLAVFAGFMFVQWQRATAATAEAESRRREASREKLLAEQRALVAEARGAENKGLSDDAYALYRAALSLSQEAARSNSDKELLELARLDTGGAGARVMEGPARPMFHVAGSELHGLIVAAGSDEDVFVFEAASGKILHRLPHRGLVWKIAVSPDQRLLATAASDNRSSKFYLRLYALPSLELVREESEALGIATALRFNQDGTSLFLLPSEGDLIEYSTSAREQSVWSGTSELQFVEFGPAGVMALSSKNASWLRDGAKRLMVPAARGDITATALSPEGKAFARGTADGYVEGFELATGRELFKFSLGKQKIAELRWADEAHVIASAEGKLSIYDLADKRNLALEVGKGRPHFDVADGRLALVRDSLNADLYDVASGVRLETRTGHEGEITAVAVYAGSLLSVGWDKKVRLAVAERPFAVEPLSLRPQSNHLALSQNGERLVHAVSSLNSSQVLLQRLSGESAAAPVQQVLRGMTMDAAISEDGTRAVMAGHRGVAFLSDSEQKGIELDGEPRSVGATPDCKRVAIGDQRGQLQLFEWTQPLTVVPAHDGGAVVRVELSRDGLLIASSGEAALRVNRFDDGAELFAIDAKLFNLEFAFSPNGELFAVADQESVSVFRTSDFAPILHAPQSDLSPSGLAFSPDSKLLAVATSQAGSGAVRVFDLEQNSLLLLEGAESALDVAFADDGRRLFVSGNSGALTVWQDLASPPRSVHPFDRGSLLLQPLPNSNAVFTAAVDRAVVRSELPLVTPAGLLEQTAFRSNLRVCRSTMRVVALTGTLEESPFAPDELCAP
jgi:WD40 repeat protein